LAGALPGQAFVNAALGKVAFGVVLRLQNGPVRWGRFALEASTRHVLFGGVDPYISIRPLRLLLKPLGPAR
jgi:hypothetical protein